VTHAKQSAKIDKLMAEQLECPMTDETYERLRSKLTLDPLDLDQELIELPMLIMEAAELTANRVTDRDRAKNELDVAMAQAADHLRRTPVTDGKGGTKVRSEAQIETEIPLYDNVQSAVTKLEDAKLELALWQALCDSLRAKRDSLKLFADLTISGYLSPNTALSERKTEIRTGSSYQPRRRIKQPA
jgi:hypothetical protein